MLTDIQRAMLGDHDAAARLTERGVLIPCCGNPPDTQIPFWDKSVDSRVCGKRAYTQHGTLFYKRARD